VKGELAICWVGVGTFGLPMASRLAETGNSVRTPIVDGHGVAGVEGMRAAFGTVARANGCGDADVLCLCLPSDDDIASVLATLEHSLPPLVIDFSTADPALSRARARRLQERAIAYVDAPVSGSTIQARAGQLTIFCGIRQGECAPFDTVIAQLSANRFDAGERGGGLDLKLLNQMMHIGIMAQIAEVHQRALATGIEPEKAFAAILASSGSSRMLERFSHKIAEQNMDVHFALDMAIKDIGLVSRSMGDDRAFPLWQAVETAFRRARDRHIGFVDFTAICHDAAPRKTAGTMGGDETSP